MFSIDQNCHPLWDVIAKVQALAEAGYQTTHFIEDIDTAFTALGSQPDQPHMELAVERFHRSGGQDWGAALFYSKLLGKLPVEIRQFEPYTGMKTNTLAKHMGLSVDELYDRYSPSDNWQLIGSSYVGDRRHHRVIGDLAASETAPFIHELLDLARRDLLERFVEHDARQRINDWFDAEIAQVEPMLAARKSDRLVDLYHDWMRQRISPAQADIRMTSELFATAAPGPGGELFQQFCADYDRMAGLYNQALEETDSPLRALRRKNGELPFFAVCRHQGHQVRCHVNLDDGRLVIVDRQVKVGENLAQTLANCSAAGIEAIAGKALLLVIQVRMAPAGQGLAMPYQGSLYMPAAHRLEAKLRQAQILSEPLAPLLRVRFNFLDAMAPSDTVLQLPDHLAAAAGAEEMPASALADTWADLQAEAGRRLEQFKIDQGRQEWQKADCGDLLERIEQQDARREAIARENPKDPRMREIWARTRQLKSELLERTVDQIAQDWQVAQVDYWDSRGALLPWSIALGGENFYDRLINQAEIYEESPAQE